MRTGTSLRANLGLLKQQSLISSATTCPRMKAKMDCKDTGLVNYENPGESRKQDNNVKKSCKNINITDAETVYDWVYKCVNRHYKRYDFRKLLIKFGMKKDDYEYLIKSHDHSVLATPVMNISRYACDCIRKRKIILPPVHIRIKKDNTTFKERLIGKESALQQVFDYIAVYSCDEIWRRRLVPQQASSIKGRGPEYGMRMIRHNIIQDNRSIRYANKHNLRYNSKCKYFVKLDAKKCYPNAKKDILMKYLRHDCANEDILWLWDVLLSSHRVKIDGSEEIYEGFMIGALPSMWGMQLLLSYTYRYVMSLNNVRHGKKIKYVNHAVLFMDDILLQSGNKKYLKLAVKKLQKYASENLGITIKDNYSIKNLDNESIDMMGYVLDRRGVVTIRGRNFVHTRRLALRYERNHTITINFARRLISYKGRFKYSDTKKAAKKYNLNKLFEKSASFISRYDRRLNYESILY